MLIEVFSSLPWIPDPVPKDDVSEKYLPYEEVVGTETTDKHRQSFGTGGNQIDSDRKDLLVSTRLFLIFVSVFISCIFCVTSAHCIYVNLLVLWYPVCASVIFGVLKICFERQPH